MDKETEQDLLDVARTPYVKESSDFGRGFQKVRDAARSRGDREGELVAQWELEAFSLVSRPQLIRNGDRRPLLPSFVLGDGSTWPDVDAFPIEQFEFYRRRLRDESNPLLAVRYSDIMFEFGWSRVGDKRYDYAIRLVVLLLQLFQLHLEREEPYYLGALRVLDRAVSAATLMRNPNLFDMVLSRVPDVITSLETGGIHRWVLELSELIRSIRSGPFGDRISGGLDTTIIQHVTHAKNHYLLAGNFILHREFCGELARWLRLRGEQDRSTEEEIGSSFEAEAKVQQTKDGGSSLVRATLLEKALQHYINTGGPPEKIAALKVEIHAAYEQAVADNEFKEVPFEVPLDRTRSVAFINAYVEGCTLQKIIEKLATDRSLVPNVTLIRQEAETSAHEHPLLTLFTQSYVGDGRKVAEADHERDKLEALVVRHYLFDLGYLQNLVLIPLFSKLEEGGLSATDLVARFEGWSEVDSARLELLRVGFSRFISGDFVSAIHVLVPQLEAMLRRLFSRAGYAVTKVRAGTAQHEESLTEFLRRTDVKGALGDDYQSYLEVVMVSQIGLNLRNAVAHGLLHPQMCNKETAILVIHQLLILTSYSVRRGLRSEPV